MKTGDIQAGRVYCTKTGNAARKVLRIGGQADGLPRPRWFGDDSTEPGADAAIVEYLQTRGPHAGEAATIYLSQFAAWAHRLDAGTALEQALDIIATLEREIRSTAPEKALGARQFLASIGRKT